MYFFLVIPRTSQGVYPALPPCTPPPGPQPSAPPLPDEGYTSGENGRGVVRPHSVSPFTRNVRLKAEEEEMDVEAAISALVSFSDTRREISTVTTFGDEDVSVKTFRTSTPTTPAAAPRPDCPPRIVSRRVLPMDTPRPRPLHRASAALGAPPRDREDQSSSEEEGELPDIPESPASPTYSDITVRRLVYFFSPKERCFFMIYFLEVTFMIFYLF